MHIKQRILLLKKLAQMQDVRRLQNIKPYLFDEIGWTSLNQIINLININLAKLSNNILNFQIVSQKAASEGGSKYSGSLKNLVNLSQWLYNIIMLDRKNQPYSYEETNKIIDDLISTVNLQSFPEAGMSDVRSNIINLANSWAAKLKKP